MSRWRAIVRSELEEIHTESTTQEISLDDLESRILPRLADEFPDNNNLEAGLRRTLQELRDEGQVEFLGGGDYRITLDQTPPLADLFQEALSEYSEAKTREDREHSAAKLITDRIPHELSNVLSQEQISIKSSIGRGSMANIPWIGVFDTRVTTSPQEGLYVVYLFDTAAETVFLTLNQGMTDLQESYGSATARTILSDRASALRTVVDVRGFENGEIELTPELLTGRNNLYGISTICYRAYELGNFPESTIIADDLSRLVSEYQRLLGDGIYERLLDAFDEEGPVQQNPFEDDPLQPAADEYEGVSEATDDVLRRLDVGAVEPAQFYEQVSKSIVTAWSDLLSKISVQTDSEITLAEAVLIDQIKQVYSDAESWLTETATDLGVGSLFTLDPPQVLYMALLRDIQSASDDVSRVNVNHVKLKTIFNDEYSVQSTETEDDLAPEHPLLSILDSTKDERSVYLFTGPPDYWLSAIRYRAISFDESNKNRWREVSGGDIAILHSRATPGRDDLDLQPNGFLGAGILGETCVREGEAWWWEEIEGDEEFSNLVSFDRLFVTGDLETIDQTARIEQQSTEMVASELEALTTNILDFSTVNDRCQEETGRGIQAQGMFGKFRTADSKAPDYERPRIILEELAPKLSEVAPVSLHRDLQPTLSDDLLEGLHFQDNEDDRIIQEIEAALRGGKHIILTGPPGTGKTEIARYVVTDLESNYPYLYSGSQITTATADWSTFDTVGGYMPTESTDADTEELSFTAGTVLNRLRDRDPDRPINESLVIDELNRADIDKAFGQLFTVLSGQSVTLPYTRAGQEIEILPAGELEGLPTDNQYVIPKSWRMFATMNTYDKTSLYEMSYAFMRRFAFIRVGVPSLDDLGPAGLQDLVEQYIDAWEHDELAFDLQSRELRAIGAVWQQTNTAIEDRAIGPAIIRDIALYLDNHTTQDLQPRLTQAVIAYIFPQLEGVPKRKEIVEKIAGVNAIDFDHLTGVAREMLQVTFEEER